MIHPERTPLLLTTGELTKAIPDFNWKERHSGEMLNDVQFSLFGIEFIKAVISICHEPEETYVPLYFKKEYLPNAQKGTLVRGFLWMQGKIEAEN